MANWKGYLTGILANGRSSSRISESTLDEKSLEALWKTQKGKCQLTGIPIKLRYQNEEENKENNPLLEASLDRIDNNNKKYEDGNVQFVAYGVNLMKNKYTEEQFYELIDLIVSTNEYQARRKQPKPNPVKSKNLCQLLGWE